MKSIFYTFLFSMALLIVSCSGTTTNSEAQEDTAKHQMNEHQHDADDADKAGSTKKKKPASPKKEAMAMVGSNHIHIEYGSPSVRGRVIWGGLVSYNKVWSTGAHKATSINFPEPVVINGTDIPAGKYGFFTIPGENTWTVIFNKTWDMHLADDYEQDEDMLRFEVTPEKLDTIQEALEYKVESTGDDTTGTISVAWGNLKISFDITNK